MTMKKHLADLACRRRELLKEIESQRMQVAEISQRWRQPLALLDIGLKAVRFMRNHPALVSGGVALLLAWRRKEIAGMAQGGGRWLCLYPSILSIGLKCLSLLTRSPGKERNTAVDH
jgi:hypothetical protein